MKNYVKRVKNLFYDIFDRILVFLEITPHDRFVMKLKELDNMEILMCVYESGQYIVTYPKETNFTKKEIVTSITKEIENINIKLQKEVDDANNK